MRLEHHLVGGYVRYISPHYYYSVPFFPILSPILSPFCPHCDSMCTPFRNTKYVSAAETTRKGILYGFVLKGDGNEHRISVFQAMRK